MMEQSKKHTEASTSNPWSSITQPKSDLSKEPTQEEGAGAGGNEVAGVVNSGDSFTVRLHNQDLGDFSLITEFPQESTGNILSMAASPDEGDVFTGSDNRMLYEWKRGILREVLFEPASRQIKAIVVWRDPNPFGSFYGFFAEPDGRTLFTVLKRNTMGGKFKTFANVGIKILEDFDLFRKRTLQKEPDATPCLCLSDDHKFMYWGSSVHPTVCVFHVDFSGGNQFNFAGLCKNEAAVHALAVGPQVVFSGLSDGKIKMWKRELDKGVKHSVVRTFDIQNGPVNALAFWNVDGVSGCLYAGSSDGNVRCWKNLSTQMQAADGPEPEVMSLMSGPSGAITCLALCEGPFVFAGTADGFICVWKRNSEDMLHTLAMELHGHSEKVTCIATQNDWRARPPGPPMWVLYSSSGDRTLKVWAVFDQATDGSLKKHLSITFRSLLPRYSYSRDSD